MKWIVSLMTITVLLSCNSAKKTAGTTSPYCPITTQGKLYAAFFQQRAAEYYALCTQAYNTAQLRLDMILSHPPAKPAAIVTDIDETVLDNSPNAVHQALQGKDFESAAWMEWTNMAKADTVPGAPSFFKYAAQKNVEVFYITNRDEAERNSTISNLKRYGFPFADSAHLLLRQNTSGKEDRRQQVLKDHEIVLLIGDNLSDFSALFDKQPMDKRLAAAKDQSLAFGNRYIVIPNFGYGDWENSLFQYKKLTQQQKDSALIHQLINY